MNKKLKHIKSLSDEQLVLQYGKSKDKSYIGELYVRYSALVLGVSLKYLQNKSEAQDNLMKVFEKLMNIELRTEVLNVKPWLYQITKNECLMALRKKKKTSFSDIEEIQISQESNLDQLEEKERLLNLLEEVIPTLKGNQRVCIELFYLNKKSYAEIAEHTQFSIKEVKSNIQNGKRNLELMMNRVNSKS
ncbi:MAG: sigma-70 family RNA polymerase sigma factor [Flavobacteriales bacterium]